MFLDWFFPRRCLGCNRPGDYFCPDCQKNLYFLSSQICPVCRKQTVLGQTHPSCQKNAPLDGLVSLLAYKGLVREAIVKIKFKGATDLLDQFMDLVGKRLVQNPNHPLRHFPRVVLIPLPLHSRRYRERGFNQAELLGAFLAAKLNWPVEKSLLVRVKSTRPQSELASQQRQKNIKNAFAAEKGPVFFKEKTIVIFDDVWTTGSTLKEAGRTLKEAGFPKVWGLTLAR